MNRLLAAAATVAALAVAPPTAGAQSVAEFYRGNTVKIIHTGSPGGSYAVYTRILAEHLGRHIPGEPKMIAEFMRGAGGLKGLNYVYNAAPKDGTVLVMPLPSVGIAHQLFGKSAKFDPTKFTWIGNITQLQTAIALWHTAPAKSLEDAKKVEVLVGSTGKASELTLTPKLLNAVIGTRFKIISGYGGVAPINLAMERGELHGRSGGFTSYRQMKPDWFQGTPKIRFVAQLGMFKHPDAPDVPLIMDLATNEADRKVLELMSRSTTLTRAVAAPPGVPADRAAALRAAFDAVLKDPAFLADMKKRRMAMVGPMNWKEIDAFLAEVAKTPAPIIKRFRAALELK